MISILSIVLVEVYEYLLLLTENKHRPKQFPRAWREAAVFGALWGAGEITLGAFLTSTRIPMGGVIMACFGVIILTAGQMLIKRRGFALRAALICAGLRSLSPGGVMFGPMFAIVLQGVIVNLAFIIFRYPLIAGIASGFMVTITSVLQALAVKLIIFGSDLWQIYTGLLAKAEGLLGFSTGQGWIMVGIFFLLIGMVGSAAGAFGWRLGVTALAREAASG